MINHYQTLVVAQLDFNMKTVFKSKCNLTELTIKICKLMTEN